MELEVVGKDVLKQDAFDKVTGSGQYTFDLKVTGMLHGKFLWSPVPHARILNIRTEKAKRVPGVKAVVTGEEVPAGRYGPQIRDQAFLARGKVRHIGEAVVGVAASGLDAAEEAFRLIEVEYEELPAVFDAREAMAEGAPLLHEDLGSYSVLPVFFPVPGTNIANHFRLRRGDVASAMKGADHIFEHIFTTPAIQHCHMEPHVVIAKVETSGKVTLWGSIQSPYLTRADLAAALGVSLNDIRVIVGYLGGGFGAKHAVQIEPLALALALKTSPRPVRVQLTREEEFTSAVTRHPLHATLRTGVRRDGTLVAREVTLIWDKGAYADCGPAVSRNAGFGSAGPYQIPHVKVDSYSVYTNKVKAGSFRGFGVPQVTWASESQIDLIAKELGMDALEFRLKNAVEAGTVSATGEVLHSVGLKEALRKAAEAIGWGRPRPPSRGVGIAAMHKNTHTPTGSSAFVKVNEDGTVNLMAGTVDMGQGVATVLRQIAAEVLGMSPDRISVTTPDTDFTPFENSTTSSRTTFHAGNAVKRAAEDALGQMLEVAAQVLEASPEDLQARGGRVFLRGAPEKGLSYPELFQRAKRLQRSVLGTASYTTSDFAVPLDKETGQSPHPTAFWMYAAQAAEVEVDLATGAVRVLRLTAAHDLGKAINPMMAHAQLEGSLVMGLGSALLEEMRFENGQVVNPQFLDYKIPRIMDVPPMETVLVEAGHALGPYGAKGLGEPGLAPTAAAIGNAVCNAVGVRIYDLPITPEKVLRALKEKERGPKGRVAR